MYMNDDENCRTNVTGVNVEEEADAMAIGGTNEVTGAEERCVSFVERDGGDVESSGGKADEPTECEEKTESHITRILD
ncbi:hypothetical protein V6N11_012557 [Hibiscus sabdariffa]|uniref:Uncharacterized protein n=1 Tax=Hibiscus sabdariffa TaxID=183260 RepID=A0ABR2QBY9_9ROSI